mmetsp:Transcript_2418/g.4251  ORF Transcript_2418/g.4251 Transcript_2418/m.4251 type:complete len:306 (-) Transcript_2418:151-1068(-)
MATSADGEHTASLFTFLPQNLSRLFLGADLLQLKLRRWPGTAHPHGLLGRFVKVAVGDSFSSAALEQWHGAIFTRLRVSHDPGFAHAIVLIRGHLQVGGSQSRSTDQGLYLGVGCCEAICKRQGEDGIGQFGLVVPLPTCTAKDHRATIAPQIATVFPQIFGIQYFVWLRPRTRGVIHNSRLTTHLSSFLQQWKELFGQKEVGKVIGLHLHIISIFRSLVRQRHDASIVTQHVNARVSKHRLQLLCAAADAFETLQITFHGGHLGPWCFFQEFLLSFLRPAALPVQHHHMGTFLSHSLCRHKASA